ncbi:hypothetical protein SAMN05421813_1316 [Daejeonella rubra]|uniref:Uncharacterized protein n=2 Tax=Daejeonella rubra TaxID=990371 RepID=A0A1G9XJG4_9SPHI|nr:hypothetical protein SAMN05421813_1316 [Daejeonella rubra]
MIGLFKPGSTFYAGDYKCVDCGHRTIIFIDTKYDVFNLMESYQTCSHCEEEKDTLSDGDLIMRYDWPDADDDPWQLQCAYMLEEDRYCTDCRDEVPIRDDWRKMVVACSQCDGYMRFTE